MDIFMLKERIVVTIIQHNFDFTFLIDQSSLVMKNNKCDSGFIKLLIFQHNINQDKSINIFIFLTSKEGFKEKILMSDSI